MGILFKGGWSTDERGASAAEYALLISLIAAVIMVGVSAFGLQVQGSFDNSCRDFATTVGDTC